MSQSQYDFFWDLYNNVLDTINSSIYKVFVTLVNGVPGSGKSLILIELLIALMRTTKTGKQTKILVTAGTEDEIDALAYELHKIRHAHPSKFELKLRKQKNNKTIEPEYHCYS